METANFLALFWGFSLAIIGFGFLLHPKHIKKVFQLMEDEGFLLFCGIFNVMLGVLLILFYNEWTQTWKVVITILGWLVLAKGIIRIFFADWAMEMMQKIKNKPDWFNFYFLGTIIFGCFLIFMGFYA
ncbi:MAG: hypothetical protein AAB877_02285 [Patescibacteria group bacterium]